MADPDRCPIDHSARAEWLQLSDQPSPSSTPSPLLRRTSIRNRFSLDSGRWESLPFTPLVSQSQRSDKPASSLSTDREISSIPRATSAAPLNSAEKAALPANNETDTGRDAASGNWVYPSQEQFFAAMQRKGHAANAADMSSVVPIHNAVNERAWREIQLWERGRGSEQCGGPKLLSFAGDSKRLTPRARWNSLLGYEAPFDRHDWVVDRCGKRVEYVIDFYKGKSNGGPLSFYLDVRPKLNSWEGIRMRASRMVGS